MNIGFEGELPNREIDTDYENLKVSSEETPIRYSLLIGQDDMGKLEDGNNYMLKENVGGQLTSGSFYGSLDGAGHTVRVVDKPFFGKKVASYEEEGKSEVRNLTVEGYVSGEGSVGALAGTADNITVANIINHASVTAQAGAEGASAGALFGSATATTIKNITNTAPISTPAEYSENAGALVGEQKNTTIEESVNTGEVNKQEAFTYWSEEGKAENFESEEKLNETVVLTGEDIRNQEGQQDEPGTQVDPNEPKDNPGTQVDPKDPIVNPTPVTPDKPNTPSNPRNPAPAPGPASVVPTTAPAPEPAPTPEAAKAAQPAGVKAQPAGEATVENFNSLPREQQTEFVREGAALMEDSTHQEASIKDEEEGEKKLQGKSNEGKDGTAAVDVSHSTDEVHVSEDAVRRMMEA